MDPIVLKPGEGRTIPSAGGREPTIKVFGEDTDGAFTVLEGFLPPETEGPPRHLHRAHEESFYVLEGTLWLQIGDEEIQAAPGTYAFVPRGTPHMFSNRSSQPVRFLGVHSPGVEHMLIALANATTPQEIGEIAARFDTELA
jgi:quercetin dioxygenase-like cupin family protein